MPADKSLIFTLIPATSAAPEVDVRLVLVADETSSTVRLTPSALVPALQRTGIFSWRATSDTVCATFVSFRSLCVGYLVGFSLPALLSNVGYSVRYII